MPPFWEKDLKRQGTPLKQQQVETGIAATEANTDQSRVSAMRGAADADLIRPQTAAEIANIELRNAQLVQENEKLKKGLPLEQTQAQKLIDGVRTLDDLGRARDNAKPDYFGSVVDWAGNLENTAQARAPEFMGTVGTPGQANYWQDLEKSNLIERHGYFGGALTPTEKESWNKTVASPGMNWETAKGNLEGRYEVAREALSRMVNEMKAGGYNMAQINAALGSRVGEVNPRWMTPQQERQLAKIANSKDFTPKAYANALVQIGEANSVPVQPDQALAAAQSTAETRAKGVPFGTEALYQSVAPTTEKEDDEAVGATSIGDVGGGTPPGMAPELGRGDASGGTPPGTAPELGWGETAVGAAKNLIPSTIEMGKGVWNAVTHPIDTVKTIGELAGGALTNLGVADFDDEKADALGAYYADRYGSVEGFKQALANDPAGILSDAATILSGGAGAASKLGITGKIAQSGNLGQKIVNVAGAVTRNIDPLTASVKATTSLAPLAAKYGVKITGKVLKKGLGVTTGLRSGEAQARAANIGFEQGKLGQPTSRSTNFIEQLRGGAPAEDVISQADDVLREMQRSASDAYKQGMVPVANDKTVLDFTDIDQTLTDLEKSAYYKGEIKNPTAQRVHAKIKDIVEGWKLLDPAEYHTPEGMDALKQRIGDVSDDLLRENDQSAVRIAKKVYGQVRNDIAKQVPAYAEVMKNYEDAAGTIRDIRQTLSLNPTATVDTQLRKLQTLMLPGRDSVGTFKGQLTDKMAGKTAPVSPQQAAAAAKLDDTIVAQQASHWVPQTGGRRVVASGAGAAGAMGAGLAALPFSFETAALLNPNILMALPAMSPRLTTEAAYAGGRAAGATERVLRPATSKVKAAANTTRQLTDKYRLPALAGMEGARVVDAAEGDIDLEKLMRRYRPKEGE